MTTTPGRGLVRWRLALSGSLRAEAVLDKGWFTNAASRAMMIGSRWYDRAMPDEKVIGKDGMNRIINLLGKYAKTRLDHYYSGRSGWNSGSWGKSTG